MPISAPFVGDMQRVDAEQLAHGANLWRHRDRARVEHDADAALGRHLVQRAGDTAAGRVLHRRGPVDDRGDHRIHRRDVRDELAIGRGSITLLQAAPLRRALALAPSRNQPNPRPLHPSQQRAAARLRSHGLRSTRRASGSTPVRRCRARARADRPTDGNRHPAPCRGSRCEDRLKPCRQGTHRRNIARCRGTHGPVTVVTPRRREGTTRGLRRLGPRAPDPTWFGQPPRRRP
jgi:hypothetical protein